MSYLPSSFDIGKIVTGSFELVVVGGYTLVRVTHAKMGRYHYSYDLATSRRSIPAAKAKFVYPLLTAEDLKNRIIVAQADCFMSPDPLVTLLERALVALESDVEAFETTMGLN